MAGKNPQPKKNTDKKIDDLTLLLNNVKNDNLAQFGEVKKEFGGITTSIKNHEGRLTSLEKDKIERDAIKKYQDAHPEVSKNTYDAGRGAYNESAGTITVNKDLLKALKVLGLVIAALAAAVIGMKYTP